MFMGEVWSFSSGDRVFNISLPIQCILHLITSQVTGILSWIVRSWTDVENNIVSVERVKEYAETPKEASPPQTQIWTIKLPLKKCLTNRQHVYVVHRLPGRWRAVLCLLTGQELAPLSSGNMACSTAKVWTGLLRRSLFSSKKEKRSVQSQQKVRHITSSLGSPWSSRQPHSSAGWNSWKNRSRKIFPYPRNFPYSWGSQRGDLHRWHQHCRDRPSPAEVSHHHHTTGRSQYSRHNKALMRDSLWTWNTSTAFASKWTIFGCM